MFLVQVIHNVFSSSHHLYTKYLKNTWKKKKKVTGPDQHEPGTNLARPGPARRPGRAGPPGRAGLSLLKFRLGRHGPRASLGSKVFAWAGTSTARRAMGRAGPAQVTTLLSTGRFSQLNSISYFETTS